MQKRRTMWYVLLALVMVVVVIGLGACAGGDESGETMADEVVEGEALLQGSCTTCHNLDRVTSKQYTAEQWEQSVDRMISKGAQVSDKVMLVEYLTMTYGP
jgi:hypothetical protein